MEQLNNIGASLDFYIFVSIALFSIGAIGVLTRKNMIVLLMCIELMLNAVNLLLVTFSTFFGNGEIFVFFIIVVAAAEATIGLSILIMAYRNSKSIDIEMFNKLNG
jgi:NADH-quinone oxidoreductase subunit K